MIHLPYQLALARHDELRRQAVEHRLAAGASAVRAGTAPPATSRRRTRRLRQVVRVRVAARG